MLCIGAFQKDIVTYISVPDGQKDVQLRSFHIQTKWARRIERPGRQMIPQQDSHQGIRYKVGGDLQVNAAQCNLAPEVFTERLVRFRCRLVYGPVIPTKSVNRTPFLCPSWGKT